MSNSLIQLSFPTVHQSFDVNGNSIFYFEGKQLYQWLGVKTPYHKWSKRKLEQHSHTLKENIDFITTDNFVRGSATGIPEKEHYFTLRAALHICMSETTIKGGQLRDYIIDKLDSIHRSECQSITTIKKQIQDANNLGMHFYHQGLAETQRAEHNYNVATHLQIQIDSQNDVIYELKTKLLKYELIILKGQFYEMKWDTEDRFTYEEVTQKAIELTAKQMELEDSLKDKSNVIAFRQRNKGRK